MSARFGPRLRIAFLTLVVVLSAVQPVPAGAQATETGTEGMGDVGAAGSAVERHPASAGATADALRSVRADAVHAKGLTGSGVDVGVIGRGFDTSNAVVAPHVVDWRQVGDPPRSTAHDTAVAEVVSETAPSADLYLAGVGRTPTPTEYAAAVEWLTDRGADVIVDSGSYFPSVAADERRITAAAERATDEGVVFVTSAGNYANRHWAGAGTRDGWVTFADDDAANHLADGAPLRGRVTVRLRWRSAADYDLYLYRYLPDGADRVVAKSTDDATGPGLTVEGIDVAVPRGRYYVGVYADDPTTDPGRVQVFAVSHRLEHATARGSMVAPATSDRVIAVGAAANGEDLAYSSVSAAGGVDVIAPAGARTRADPTFAGTSAAAPYVAGTAALMESGANDPSPVRVESILERTADGEGGALDALAAVEAATDDEATRDDATGARLDGVNDQTGGRLDKTGDASANADADASADRRRDPTTDDAGRNATRSGAGDEARPTDDGAERSDDGRRSGDDGRTGEGSRADEGDDTDRDARNSGDDAGRGSDGDDDRATTTRDRERG